MKGGTFALVFLIGLLAGFFAERYEQISGRGPLRGEAVRQGREAGFRLTNPLLECELAPDSIGAEELRPFKHQVEDVVERALREGRASHVSVYFRDLNNGPWFGIREKENFHPASLLKVPVMLAYFKIAEYNPGILKKQVRYQGGQDANSLEYFKPSRPIEPGKSYTIDELIYRMIVYSDNNAKDLLFDNLNPTVLAEVYRDLGLEIPGERTPEDFMSVKSYASFFRILYNASYLNKELSEKALQYLAEADFRPGLMAGVDPNLAVAHKFGEYAVDDKGDIKQLHDCGIVYYPKSPYLLCVMTRGQNFESLEGIIQDVSHSVFTEIDLQHNPARLPTGK